MLSFAKRINSASLIARADEVGNWGGLTLIDGLDEVLAFSVLSSSLSSSSSLVSTLALVETFNPYGTSDLDAPVGTKGGPVLRKPYGISDLEAPLDSIGGTVVLKP